MAHESEALGPGALTGLTQDQATSLDYDSLLSKAEQLSYEEKASPRASQLQSSGLKPNLSFPKVRPRYQQSSLEHQPS